MNRKDIFMSKALIEHINIETQNNNKNFFIEDMVTGEYYRCYNITTDNNNNLILQIKNIKDLENGTNDLYMNEELQALYEEEKLDNMIRDTLPDDDYFEMHEPGYHIDTMLGRIIYDNY